MASLWNSVLPLLTCTLNGIDQTQAIVRLRDRLNTAVISVAGGLWFAPMSIFWMRFLPPFRPFDFATPFPPPAMFALCVVLCLAPMVLPRAYFETYSFERGRFYPRLGVRLFRLVATSGDLINRRLRTLDPRYRVVRGRADLREHIRGTLTNERAHLGFLIAGSFTAYFAAITGEMGFTAALLAGNTVFNLYPILHQRYKRARLRRLTL